MAGAGIGRHAHASRALRVPAGPACGRPLTADPPALGQGVAGRAMALPASCPGGRSGSAPRAYAATGGRSPRWVCGSRGVFGAGRRVRRRPGPARLRCARTGRRPSGSTGAAGRGVLVAAALPGLCGSQKKISMSAATATCFQSRISGPWSQVNDRRTTSGRVWIFAASAGLLSGLYRRAGAPASCTRRCVDQGDDGTVRSARREGEVGQDRRS